MIFLYLDSSAIVKLIAPEAESPALVRLVSRFPARISSAIAIVEVGRAVRRAGVRTSWENRAAAILNSISLLSIDREILEKSARMEPPGLRSLDAIHLASALTLQEDLEAFVTYDRKLFAAAEQIGFRTVAPV